MTDPADERAPRMPAPGRFDEIPVEELVRLTREFTRRITNQDRQRLTLGLRESGHLRRLPVTGPPLLQQFFAGEIDLDADLEQRFPNAPLMSRVRILSGPGQIVGRRASAVFSSNDEAATLTVETEPGAEAGLEFTFTLFSALAQRFRLAPLAEAERSRWLDLMRRENGIAFLWTVERWEQPHAIAVVRESYARLYAFSPHGGEAAARLTPDMTAALLDWLEAVWFAERAASQASLAHANAGPRASLPQAPDDEWDGAPAPSDEPQADELADDLEW